MHFEACMDNLRELSRKEAMRGNVISTERDFRIHFIHSTVYRETFSVTVRCRRASDSLIGVGCNGAVQWVEGVSKRVVRWLSRECTQREMGQQVSI
jgi:hypothetical protein